MAELTTTLTQQILRDGEYFTYSGGASVLPLVSNSNVNFWRLVRLCSGRIDLAKNDVAIFSRDFFILFSQFQITAQIVLNDFHYITLIYILYSKQTLNIMLKVTQ